MKKQQEVEKNAVLQDDILRYKKNKFASRFALLGLAFNCLYFMLFYSVNQSDIYTPLVGFSVIVNLLVMLIAFYASEGIKGYDKRFSIVLIVLAVVQIVRIFIYPLQGMTNDYLKGNFYFALKMNSVSNGLFFIIYLVASAACFIVAAVNGYLIATRLEKFQKQLDSGEVSVEATLKELDEKDAAEGAVTENEAEQLAEEIAEEGANG